MAFQRLDWFLSKVTYSRLLPPGGRCLKAETCLDSSDEWMLSGMKNERFIDMRFLVVEPLISSTLEWRGHGEALLLFERTMTSSDYLRPVDYWQHAPHPAKLKS